MSAYVESTEQFILPDRWNDLESAADYLERCEAALRARAKLMKTNMPEFGPCDCEICTAVRVAIAYTVTPHSERAR